MSTFCRYGVQVRHVPYLAVAGPGGGEDVLRIGGKADTREGSVVAKLGSEIVECLQSLHQKGTPKQVADSL